MNRFYKVLSLILCLMLAFTGCSVRGEISSPDETEASLTQLISSVTEAEIQTTEEPESTAEKTSASEKDKNGNTITLSVFGNSKVLTDTVALAVGYFNAAGYETHTDTNNENADVVLKPVPGLGEEGYTLDYDRERFEVCYTESESCNGALYGLNAVLKMLLSGKKAELPPTKTRVIPDTKERTLMLDCARKYWSVDFVKKLIDEMCWMGYNTIEFHFTEEQGIRFNIWEKKNGTKVRDCNGNDFSFICGGSKVSWNKDYSEKTGVYYDRDEIEEILDYAISRHLEIIPAVDLPGHSYNLIRRCRDCADGREFTYNGKTYSLGEDFSASGSNSQCVDISSERARALTYAITEAYAEYFRDYGCKKINIGADEVKVDDSAWRGYALVNGGSTQFDAFIIYINSLCRILKDKGYTVRAFNDYLFSAQSNVKLDPELEICWWNGSSASFPKNRVLYNCIQNNCYYVLRKTSNGVDARDKGCTHWDFNHSNARRIYCGCGNADCSCRGGWNTTRFWKNDFSSPAGGYFLIWGDWAASDTESNIFYRTDDYGLVDRMWANITKMIDRDADESMSFGDFQKSVEPYRIYPGGNKD